MFKAHILDVRVLSFQLLYMIDNYVTLVERIQL
jgi:hypothetical protein